MAQLGEKVKRIEQLKFEKVQKKQKFLKHEKINFVEESDKDQSPGYSEVHIVKHKEGPPYAYQVIRPKRTKERLNYINKKIYMFDVTKIDKIFDIFLKDKQLKLSEDYRLKKA